MNQNDELHTVHGRRIISDDERSGGERYEYPNAHTEQTVKKRHVTPNGIRRHHQNKQRARRIFMARVRAAVVLLLAAVVIASVLLLTPLCNIRYVTVEGNQYVSSEEILQLAGDLTSSNLITTGKKDITAKIKINEYINTVDIEKKLFPPTLTITVTEHIPTAYIQFGDAYYILDESLYVISQTDIIGAETLPCVTGCAVKSAAVGETLRLADEDETENLEIFTSIMAEGELEGQIISIDFSDESDITFNYDNRITVSCGSAVELESKLRLFIASVNSGELDAGAKGTMDLSTVGTATYLP